jgi:predicted RNA-binding Zn ribbon-like protein
MAGQQKRIDRAMRFDTGAGWLDLLATVGSAYGPDPVERVPGVAELDAWLDHQGLTPRTAPDGADVVALHGLREALRPLALAAVAGDAVTEEQVTALQPYLDRAVPPRATLVDGVPAPGPPETVDDALARLTQAALVSLGGPERQHLGACGDDECRMVFLDPAGRRRWCSSQRCGVRARVRAHRARTDDSGGRGRSERS